MIYDSINQLEPVEQDGQYFRPVTELYVWPAGIAIAIWLILLANRLVSGRYHPTDALGEVDRG